jgi:enoyl-CoA hydratase
MSMEQRLHEGNKHLYAAFRASKADDLVLSERSEPDGLIATLTLNRPRHFNAFTTSMWRALRYGVQDLPTDGSVRVVILQGARNNFSGGADLPELLDIEDSFAHLEGRDRKEAATNASIAYFDLVRKACEAIEAYPFPFIGKLKGYVLGAGNDLAQACDIRVADTTVKTGVPAGDRGIMLPPHELRRFALSMGIGHASEIIYTGDQFDAQDSKRLGQVSRVVEPTELDEVVMTMAQKIATQSPESLMSAKEGFRLFKRNPGFTDADIDPNVHYHWAGGANFREGLAAFREKRAPIFLPIDQVD